MKKSATILSLLTSLLMVVLMGSVSANYIGVSPVCTMLPLAGGSVLLTFAPLHGVLQAGVLTEAWTGILLKNFRAEESWLAEVPQLEKKYIKDNVIHLVDIGADPEVLINNTTYPIAVASRTDTDVPIALDKLDTTNTKVTADELRSLPYDKEGSVIDQHKEVLAEKAAAKSAHSLAPSVNTADTPVIVTTGASDGETYARKRLVPADLVTFKNRLDTLKVPKVGRILVLNPKHVNDLLTVSEAFEKQYVNKKAGVAINLYGFKVYEFADTPVYHDVSGTLTKVGFGAAAAPATDQIASFGFYRKRVTQATGDTEMFYNLAKTNPQYRESTVGFRQYHICLPKKNKGFGAIVSDLVS